MRPRQKNKVSKGKEAMWQKGEDTSGMLLRIEGNRTGTKVGW